MTLGQLNDVHKYYDWMYIIKSKAEYPGEVIPTIPPKVRHVTIDYIYPTLYTLFDGSANATVKPCLNVIVNATEWQEAVGHA